MSKKVQTKIRTGKTARFSSKRSSTSEHMRSTVVNEKPQFDKDVDHLPKSVIERQVERLMRKNKQALDELSRL